MVGLESTQYSLLYLQPNPERGERVCVGLVIGNELMFDPQMRRARCIAEKNSEKVFQFYLMDMRDRLRHKQQPSDVLRAYAPLFDVSEPRLIAKPVTDQMKHELLTHYLGKVQSRKNNALRVRQGTIKQIDDFALTLHLRPFELAIRKAKASDVFGFQVKAPRVALALKSNKSAVVVDGVDLNVFGDNEAYGQTDKINRKFWQYGRIAENLHRPLGRVALIFNGNPNKSASMQEAHDYALQQLRHVSDLAIDTSLPEAKAELEHFVAQSLD